jgi:hypothetical protein
VVVVVTHRARVQHRILAQEVVEVLVQHLVMERAMPVVAQTGKVQVVAVALLLSEVTVRTLVVKVAPAVMVRTALPMQLREPHTPLMLAAVAVDHGMVIRAPHKQMAVVDTVVQHQSAEMVNN